jgi:hypothetical protein
MLWRELWASRQTGHAYWERSAGHSNRLESRVQLVSGLPELHVRNRVPS